MTNVDSWVVLKFGGTSVATHAQWQTIAGIIRACVARGERPFLVFAALANVSRRLEELIRAVQAGDGQQEKRWIKSRHFELARHLGLDGEELLAPYLSELDRLSLGIGLTAESSPATRARVLAVGELLITRLAAAYLNGQGLSTTWLDARTLLSSTDEPRTAAHREFLAASCAAEPDPDLQLELSGCQIALTQGFIAGNGRGQTVLLGWGGSDTSAAYFAAKLQARRLEIWTDVPGMFTADPRRIPAARLLRYLDYEEAQELASTGAEVLHPRCLDPVRAQRIPLHLRHTDNPESPGTLISDSVPGHGAHVKAISMRTGLTLVSMETPRMWHQVGFLARIFAAFERFGLSVGLVATSESNVTVSIDPVRGAEPESGTLKALMQKLESLCQPRIIGPCASVSLVGRQLRSVLHELGPALQVLEEQQVLLVTQAASDLNLTFVVTEKHAERLVSKLHSHVFATVGAQGPFGPTYRELQEADMPAVTSPWWHIRRAELLRLPTPAFVYDAPTLQDSAQRLLSIKAIDRCFYAVKACGQREVLDVFHRAGLGFECVSPGELEHIRDIYPDLETSRILFTPNLVPREEYAEGFAHAGFVTLDSVRPLELWPELFESREVIVRVDPGRGQGHHQHVRTAGAQTKFGVSPATLPRLRQLARSVDLRIIGLHAHVGSGILVPETWSETAFFLSSLVDLFPEVRLVNIGGGLGVPEYPGTLPLDLQALGENLERFKNAHEGLALWMEPGRYLVAEAGVLLVRVTQVKRKGAHYYIGVDTGMNSLIRPALYGSYHAIVNLTRLAAPAAMTADVVGPICETGDILGRGRRLPETREGDVLLIATAGAYGRVMSSSYNHRAPASEIVLQ